MSRLKLSRNTKKGLRIGGMITIAAVIILITVPTFESIIGGTPASFNAISLNPTSALSMIVTDSAGIKHRVDASPGAASISYTDPNNVNSPVLVLTGGTWLSYPNSSLLPQQSVAPIEESWTLQGIASYKGVPLNISEVVYHHVIYYSVAVLVRSGPRESFTVAGPGTSAANSCYISPFEGIVDYRDYYLSNGRPNNPRPFTNMAPALPWNAETRGALTIFNYATGGGSGDLYAAYKTNTMNSAQVFNDASQRNNAGYYVASNAMSTHSPYAQITTSLVPFGSQNSSELAQYHLWKAMGINVNPPAYRVVDLSQWPSVLALNDAVAHVSSSRPVNVQVSLNLAANTQQVRNYNADFSVTLKNGTMITVKVDTVSAIVGFNGYNGEGGAGYPVGIQKTGSYKGIVTNTNPAHQIPSFGLTDAHSGASSDPANNAVTSNEVNGFLHPVTATGYLQVNSASNYTVLPGTIVTNSITSTVDGHAPYIDLTNALDNNAGMPDSLWITIDNEVGPRLTVAQANAMVKTSMFGEEPDLKTWAVVNSTYGIHWPFAAQADNYAYIQNFTIPVDVVSERNIQLFSSEGHPIPVSSLSDTDINAIYTDPKTNTIKVNDTGPALNGTWWDRIFNDLTNWWNNLVASLGIFGAWVVTIIMVVVAILVVYGIAWIIVKFRRLFKK